MTSRVSDTTDLADPRDITLGALFMGFLRIALSGFGGVLAWARWLIVEQRRWLSDQDFTAMLGLCQFLPGPNIVNVSIYVGARFRGPVGSIAAFTGLMAVPMAIVVMLGALYERFGHTEMVRGAFLGISAAASGLVIAMGLKMLLPHRQRPVVLGFALLAFVSVGVLRWPMIAVLLVLAPISIAVAWVRRR